MLKHSSLVLSLALALPVFAQTQTDSDVHELMRLETVWNQAQAKGDADTLGALWADDLEVAVPKMSVMSKEDVLAFARSGRMRFLRYDTSDVHVRVYDDSAVVTGRMQRTRVLNGKEVSDDWRFTKVYVRQHERWRVVAFHASNAVPDPN